MKEKLQKRFFIVCVLMFLKSTLFAYTATTGTGILREVAIGQMSGEIGFLIVLFGIVLAGITLIATKNLMLSLIVGIGVIFIAMSTDIATGLITQFGNQL
jgi:branched-subunit amino acid transport protein